MSTENTARRIVVGVDGSDHSKHALRWAAQLADSFGGTIDAVTAWHVPVSYGIAPIPVWDPEEDMAKCLTEAVDEVFGANRPAGLELHVRQGGAAGILVDAGKDAFMVVVGSRGHGGFAGLLLGSVSSAVAEHAPCPVLVVHGDQS
jgi:nucleotide-binding universal stress UspA family protein